MYDSVTSYSFWVYIRYNKYDQKSLHFRNIFFFLYQQCDVVLYIIYNTKIFFFNFRNVFLFWYARERKSFIKLCFYWLNIDNINPTFIFPRLYSNNWNPLKPNLMTFTTPEIFVVQTESSTFYYIIRLRIQFMYVHSYITHTLTIHTFRKLFHCLFIFWEYEIKIYDFLLLDKEQEKVKEEKKIKKNL